MKKVFLCFAMALVLYGCKKSLEEQAQEAVKNELRTSLYHFDSYEPLKTEVDSAFNEPINDPEALELMKSLSEQYTRIEGLVRQLDNAEESIAIWSSSRGYSEMAARSYNEGLKDKADAEDKMKKCATETWKTMLDLSLRIEQADKTFIGWKVKHRYRAKSREGDPSIGNDVYIFPEDFKKPLLSLDEEKYISLIKSVQDFLENLPTQDILKERIQKADKMTDAEWQPILEKMKRSVK